MDILDIYVLSKTYDSVLKNCFVDNVYRADNYWLFKLRCLSGKEYLKIEPGVRIHLSITETPSKSIDRYSVFLRKHVRDGKIAGFKQIGWERIVSITVEKSTSINLIVEIIPRGFFITLDESGRILYADKFAELKDRVVKRGVVYTPPPGNIDKEEYFSTLKKRLYSGKDLVRSVVKNWGLPSYIAEELLYRAGLYNDRFKAPNTFDEKNLDVLVDAYHEIVRECENLDNNYMVYQDDEPLLYVLYKPSLFIELLDARVEKHSDRFRMIDTYFTIIEKKNLMIREEEIVAKEISSLEKTIEEQKRIIEEFDKKVREAMEAYNALVSNYNLVEEVLECSKKIRREKGWGYIVSECKNVLSVDKDHGLIYIVVDQGIYPLDIRLDTWSNIFRFKREAEEYRAKIERAENKLIELENKRKALLEKREAIQAKAGRIVKPRYWYENYHWLFTHNNYLVIGGRDVDQNEAIVKKHMEEKDIFLHADIHGAPATVLKTGKSFPKDIDIEDAAYIAGCYSKSWKLKHGYVDVFWVFGEQVSKTPPSGEYLPKGSFMIYGKKNYVRVKLALSIGIEELCDSVYGAYQRIIVGPEDLVKSRSLVYASIAPGDESINDLARKLYEKFVDKIGLSNIGVNIEEIALRIPGSSRLVKVDYGEGERVEEC